MDWTDYGTAQQKLARSQRLEELDAPLYLDNIILGRRRRKEKVFLLIVKLKDFMFVFPSVRRRPVRKTISVIKSKRVVEFKFYPYYREVLVKIITLYSKVHVKLNFLRVGNVAA